MEFSAVLKKRRSVRQFTEARVPEEVINKALADALIAPNSSNMQPWEFYWVQTPEKKTKLVEACLSQAAARTASELIVAVARIDTWRRNRKLILDILNKDPNSPKYLKDYFSKIVPLSYFQDYLNLSGFLRKILFTIAGFFRAVPRGPASRGALFEVVSKTTALACENLMLSIVDQGYACCPMEGFDACRVKKILGLGCQSHIVMVIAVGMAQDEITPGTHFRLDPTLFLKKI